MTKYWLGKKRPKKTGEKISISHKKSGRFQMEKNPAWKGGKILRNGYYQIRTQDCSQKDGYVREHRLIMEQHIGRKLEPFEIVHHIDGNKLNNSIENLVLTNRADHSSKHTAERYETERKSPKTFVCASCDKESFNKGYIKNPKFCSHECHAKSLIGSSGFWFGKKRSRKDRQKMREARYNFMNKQRLSLGYPK